MKRLCIDHRVTNRANTLLRMFALTLLAIHVTGCASMLAPWIAHTPNHKRAIDPAFDPPEALLSVIGVDQQFRVNIDEPAASLQVWVMEPSLRELDDNATPKGTVLVLHGIRGNPLWIHNWASRLTARGYRAVLVATRGHGRSTGDFQTFGVQEARDVSHIIDDLQQRNLAGDTVGVMGISYGAATAIHAAAIDERIVAVAAVAPFSDIRVVIPRFLRTITPLPGLLITNDDYQLAIDLAGETAGFDPHDARTIDAIQQTTTPILLMHGGLDMLVPNSHSKRLHAAAPDHSQYVEIFGAGHLSIMCDLTGQVTRNAGRWFDDYLAAAPRLPQS